MLSYFVCDILYERRHEGCCLYRRSDPFGTGKKLVEISLTFIRDTANPLQIGSPIMYKTSSLMKVVQVGTALFQNSTAPA